MAETLKTWRHGSGLTLDRVATEAVRQGGTWSSSTVASLEKGIAAGSLENMIVLSKTISAIDDRPFSLSDLFPGEGDIELSDKLKISRSALRSILSGHEVDAERESSVEQTMAEFLNRRLAAELPAYLADLSLKTIELASSIGDGAIRTHQPTLAEERAAKKLGITPLAIAAMCMLEYQGRTLDEEAANRAGEHSSPQKRGRATRTILEELDTLIDHITDTGEMPAKWSVDYRDLPPQVLAASTDATRDLEAETPDE